MIDRMCRDCPQTAKGIFGIYPALSTNESVELYPPYSMNIFSRSVEPIHKFEFLRQQKKNEVANLIALWPILFVPRSKVRWTIWGYSLSLQVLILLH